MRARFLILTTLILCTFGFGLIVWREYHIPPIQKPAVAYASNAASSSNPSSASSTNASVRVPIFIYHSVYPNFAGETRTQKGYSVTPEEFEAQLVYLRDHGYTVVSLDDLLRFVAMGTTTVAKPVVLTFDDGWKNEYVNAFPLLKKYHMKGTFFIYTHPISRDSRFMTWEDVKDMDAAGMTIGDHTLSHPYLKGLTHDQLSHEILDSKKKLEEKLGKTVTHFASPFGYTSPDLVSILQAAGFTTGRTTFWGAEHSKDDLLHLSGYLVERDLNKFIYILEKAK